MVQAEAPENPVVVAAVVSKAQLPAPAIALAVEQSSPWARAGVASNAARVAVWIQVCVVVIRRFSGVGERNKEEDLWLPKDLQPLQSGKYA